MNERWRLILDPPLSGRENMDRDMALMKEVLTGESLPLLRLYRWSKPTISLGRFQEIDQVVDLEACRKIGVDLVHRPTGGRAVLHDRELTYSIIVPEKHTFVSGSVLQAYRSISSGIINAFRQLKIDSEMTPVEESKPGPGRGSCFDRPSAFEIRVEGRKVVGSAQLRRDGVLLQHGAILFSLPLDLYRAVLMPDNRLQDSITPDLLEEKAAGLHDLGYNVSYTQVERALVRAFAGAIPAIFTSLPRAAGF